MMDDADMASNAEERAMAQFEARRARFAESLRGYDPSQPVHCVDCGEVVPPARLAAYPRTRRCVGCAAEVERYYRERRQ